MTTYEREYNDERVLANRFSDKVSGALGSTMDIDWFTFENLYPTVLSVNFITSGSGLWKFQLMDEKVQVLSGKNLFPGTTEYPHPIYAFSIGD